MNVPRRSDVSDYDASDEQYMEIEDNLEFN